MAKKLKGQLPVQPLTSAEKQQLFQRYIEGPKR
jgi:hypothetical protein